MEVSQLTKSMITYRFCIKHVWFSLGLINIIAWAFFIIGPTFTMISNPNHVMGIWGPITLVAFFFLIPLIVMWNCRMRNGK